MICPVCRGSRNIVTMSRGLEYWPCSGCHGAGVLVLYGHPIVNNRQRAKGQSK